MPLYEYRCSSCGHQQEFLQKWSDAPMTVCTACGKETFSKLLTAAGFHLKGSGWYATDFKHSGSKPAVKADAKADTKADTKADAKADTKADAKPDAKPDTKADGKSDGESKKDASPPPPAAGAASS